MERLHAHDPAHIGPYRLIERLGSGGQGVVYLAVAPNGAQVAVKTFTVSGSLGRDALATAEAEITTASQVPLFATAAILDSDLTAGVPYIVREYVEGLSLSQRVRSQGVITGSSLGRLAFNTIGALAAIHRAGIVHLDFKPGNVIMALDGPCVIDFGIARTREALETTTGMPAGTVQYMSPEQISGGHRGPGSDVFSWAATMTFAATGRPPFGEDGDIFAVAHRICREEPDLSGVPAHLRGLLTRCLDKDAATRPAAWRIAQELSGHLDAGAESTLVDPAAMAALAERAAEVTTAPMPPGASAPGQHGATAPGQHGATAPAQHGAMAPAQHGATAPGQHGVTAPGQHGATAPAQHGAMAPAQHGATAPGRHAPGPHQASAPGPYPPAAFLRPPAPAPDRRHWRWLVPLGLVALLFAVVGVVYAIDRERSRQPAAAGSSQPVPTSPSTSFPPESDPCQMSASTPVSGMAWSCAVNWFESTIPVLAARSQNADRVDELRKPPARSPQAQWFQCQARGDRFEYRGYYNDWWAYTRGDADGRAGWVSLVYLKGGDNNQPDGGLPTCEAGR